MLCALPYSFAVRYAPDDMQPRECLYTGQHPGSGREVCHRHVTKIACDSLPGAAASCLRQMHQLAHVATP